jgi:NAD(P)-dependent dehydrogenase (short-subunit alcohol dehydrogenase family)
MFHHDPNGLIYDKMFVQNYLYDFAIDHGNNSITRGLQKDCYSLDSFDCLETINHERPSLPRGYMWHCYSCGQSTRRFHSNYIFCCQKCGRKFENNRYLSKDLTGKIALIVGGRTKIGHQIVLKLLRCGAYVIGTTRKPEQMRKIFEEYPDKDHWIHRLVIEEIDLNTIFLESLLVNLRDKILQKFNHIDILINSAAQTIRSREHASLESIEKNRYGDALHASPIFKNSWEIRLHDITQDEMEEIFRINVVAPTLTTKIFLPLLQEADDRPFIINVHAREGLFECRKKDLHLQTNMGKAGLAMLTKCVHASQPKTRKGKKISVNGVDPGWISVDEYFEDNRPFIVAPLDEIDGASRILYPVFKNLPGSEKTRRHYDILSY